MGVKQTIRVASFGLIILVLGAGPVTGQPLPDDSLGQARRLAYSGARTEAVRLLTAYLDEYPTDTDARTLLGTVLSWDGHYDAARVELQSVLDGNPTHADALPALVNVELWSGRPARAESLAASGLAVDPENTELLLRRSRALWGLSREDEAMAMVDRVLTIDPGNESARGLRRLIRDTERLWRADIAYRFDSFDDGRGAWHETRYSLTHQGATGSVIGRLSRADRFGLTDHQLEIEAYPRLREGTYFYVSGAVAPDSTLYPDYRIGAEVYQSVGRGFEASVGFRRLGFGTGVSIYVSSLTKYHGDWMLTGRVLVTPNSIGTSTSWHGIARRYGPGGVGYVGFRYGRGALREEIRSLADVALLNSDTLGADFVLPVGSFELWVEANASREERVARDDLWQFSTTSGFGVRF